MVMVMKCHQLYNNKAFYPLLKNKIASYNHNQALDKLQLFVLVFYN